MTGFAAAGREDDGHKVNVTIKAVNHRFLDVALKAPYALGPMEPSLRGLVKKRLTRGRVELTVSVESTEPPEREVAVDQTLLEKVSVALEAARRRGLITGGLSASDALRLPQVVEIRSNAAEATPGVVAPSVAAMVEGVVVEALDALVIMRDTEGGFLESDLDARVGAMSDFVDTLERQAQDGQAQLEARLREKLAALPPDLQAEPAAVTQELVRFVARSDVDEEIVRLRGHVEHWRTLASGPEPCGRKLDFLVQEMNREINTVGSKVEGAHVTEVVIAAKAELERIREQVQNVE
jgi:uncharacterized protein (TIGR00255 family)